MCSQMTLWGTDSATSSPESEAGRLPSGGPDKSKPTESGPAPVLVSRFRAREKDRALPTDDICGPLFTALSPSAALQDALASRLAASWDLNGSPEFDLTWREQAMPAGPPICRLVASARRISGDGCGGWLTPRARGDARGDRHLKGEVKNLEDQVKIEGWRTPTARSNGGGLESKHRDSTKEGREGPTDRPRRSGLNGELADASRGRCSEREVSARQWRPAQAEADQSWATHWEAAELVECRDGQSRRIEPGLCPLAHGVPGRVGRLRGYGNAIVPQVAAKFIRASMETLGTLPLQ